LLLKHVQKLISHGSTEIKEEIKVFPCFSCFRGKHNAQACAERGRIIREKLKAISLQ